MSDDHKHMLPEKEVSALRSKYSIVKPSRKKWIINVLIFVAFYAIWAVTIIYIDWDDIPKAGQLRILIIVLVSISLISPVLAVFLWNWIGRFVAKKLVLQTLKIKHKQQTEIREIFGELKKERKYKDFKFFRVFFCTLLNIDISPDSQYFLEEESLTSDASSIRVFLKTRMYDMITSSLSISILIAMIIKISEPESYFAGFMAGAFVILCSPLLTAWITPVVWAISDTRIKYITKKNESFQLSERMRRSILSRFFSLSAFITSMIFFSDLFEPWFVGGGGVDFGETVVIALLSLAALLIVIVLLSGTSFLVGTIYLAVFHEKNVNKLREELSHFLKYAQTNAVYSKYYDENIQN